MHQLSAAKSTHHCIDPAPCAPHSDLEHIATLVCSSSFTVRAASDTWPASQWIEPPRKQLSADRHRWRRLTRRAQRWPASLISSASNPCLHPSCRSVSRSRAAPDSRSVQGAFNVTDLSMSARLEPEIHLALVAASVPAERLSFRAVASRLLSPSGHPAMTATQKRVDPATRASPSLMI
jgi:hypothetical protein